MIAGAQGGNFKKENELALSRKAPLRVALLIDSTLQPRWIHKVLSDLLSSSFARTVLIVKNETPEGIDRSYLGRMKSVWEQRSLVLYKLYSRLDDILFREEPDAFEQVSIETLIAKIPHLTIKPLKKRFSDEFLAEDAASIREFRVDVALRFGFRILKGEALKIARYGVWSYHHGDILRYRGGPPGFWEVMNGDASTGAILQILTDDLDNGHVIYKSFAQTDKRSVRRNANKYFWQSSAFVERKLRDLYNTGPCALDIPSQPAWNPYSDRLYKAPTNLAMCRLLTRFVITYLASKTRNFLRFRQWFLAYRISSDVTGLDETFYKFTRLIPPKDRLWADPFALKRDGRFYIFFEELVYKCGKGHLSVVEVDEKGIVDGPHKILERPYHVSYPFLFNWNGELYIVPETCKARTVELYRCTSFPLKWELESVLLNDLNAVDPTLVEIEGVWWMFVGVETEFTKGLYQLHLYYADSPLGPWLSHPCNPVRAEAQSSPCAGGIVKRNGSYYRLAQEGPGYGMSVQKIERLDQEGYVETEVCKIGPFWAENLIGTHTLNSSDGLTVIDGLVERRRYF